jgi:ribosomal protein S18 acetylase RimI-like enzyme
MQDPIRLRKHLSANDRPPALPADLRLAPISAIEPHHLHALLSAAYAEGAGTISPLAGWWTSIASDEEYDPQLVFIATDPAGAPIGLVLCWNSGFIKDVAVDAAWRGRGIGESLLRVAFAAFQRRGFTHVDLKVVADNTPARRLYHRLGMVEAPL